jgi:hypothetical protein
VAELNRESSNGRVELIVQLRPPHAALDRISARKI